MEVLLWGEMGEHPHNVNPKMYFSYKFLILFSHILYNPVSFLQSTHAQITFKVNLSSIPISYNLLSIAYNVIPTTHITIKSNL